MQAYNLARKHWVLLALWVTDDGEMHHAKWHLSVCVGLTVLHLQVGTLGENGWDWHVWAPYGCVRQRYGLAGTLNEAKAKAESALGGLARDLILAT